MGISGKLEAGHKVTFSLKDVMDFTCRRQISPVVNQYLTQESVGLAKTVTTTESRWSGDYRPGTRSICYEIIRDKLDVFSY